MTKPKIVQLIDTLDPGGAERMAINMANEFTKRGFHHSLIVSRHFGSLKDQISDLSLLKILGKKNTFDIKAFRALLRELNRFEAEILHAHGTSIYWGVMAKWFRPSLRLIWHDHLGISKDVIEHNPRNEIKWLSRWIDFVITANESTKEYWLSKGYWKEERVTYLQNFPSLKLMPRKKNPVFTFVHLANFRSEKGQAVLVQAVKKLKSKGLDFKVRMVGKEVDPEWKRGIKDSIREFELENQISLEGEINDVSKLLSEVDAGLVVSEREGLPVALLEYGLAGLPVISSQVGQCPEVLERGKYGFLFPPGDIDSLVDLMEKMILNPLVLENLSQKFRIHVEGNYGPTQFFGGYEKIINL
ncbi:glycosyltransferase involved in cell wall biosynthesis [Algoriphagus boseongensis]|uniref:Glycosyltransferase involved in cell wall biosynthesis n=1 Tax=Algoriphagus boseongensis TaxID=1442587 RepID=A0A4R6T8M2_9BACT|nr:glycosyltransferase family 4 protein [Algoriphagus boseongensis]TDQ19618.1 glycosyltransferase involved in cell wall biosynthesis [Algoriphagus boseongensis]